jgi:hypothetical protein
VCAGTPFDYNIPAVNVLRFMPSNSRTVKVTGYRLASTALTLFLAIAKFSLSADNKSAPSNYLDLAGFLVGLMCVLKMPEGRYSWTDTSFQSFVDWILLGGL